MSQQKLKRAHGMLRYCTAPLGDRTSESAGKLASRTMPAPRNRKERRLAAKAEKLRAGLPPAPESPA